MMRFSHLTFMFAVILLAAPLALAGVDANVDENGVGLQGYDPVAYFTQGKPTRGNANFRAAHNNVTYYFANDDDRLTFLSEPDKYAPQYGGFCAYGTSLGIKVPSDPKEFRIVNDKLFVVANGDFMKQWSTGVPSYIKRANRIWAKIKNKRPETLEVVMPK